MIQVTQDHIDRGVAKNCASCPVALALQEVHPGEDIFVGNLRIEIGPNTYNTGIHLKHWLELFDHGYTVNPMGIELIYDTWERV